MRNFKMLAPFVLGIGIFFGASFCFTPGEALAWRTEDSTLNISGSLKAGIIMRTSDSKHYDVTNKGYPFPIKAGDMVSQRNTASLNIDWNPEWTLPGNGSFALYLQPRAWYDGAWDYGPNVMSNTGTRKRYGMMQNSDIQDDKWDVDFFMAYADMKWDGLSLRLGKQAFAWGEMTTLRILDGTNPLTNQGEAVPLEERRVPLWMARGSYVLNNVAFFDILEVEGYYNLGEIDNTNGEDLPEYAPSIMVPTGPINPIARLHTKSINDDRFGIRLGFTKGDLGVNLVYYRKYSDSPVPVTKMNIGMTGVSVDVWKNYETVDVYGFSFNYALAPIDSVLRGEAALFKREPVNSTRGTPKPAGLGFYTGSIMHSDVYRYGLGLDKVLTIPSLNASGRFNVSLEFVGSYIDTYSRDMVYSWRDPGTPESVLRTPRHSEQVVNVISTDYLNQQIEPVLTTVYDITGNAVMLIPSVTLSSLDRAFQARLTYTHTFAETYKGIGVRQNANELSLLLSYNF